MEVDISDKDARAQCTVQRWDVVAERSIPQRSITSLAGGSFRIDFAGRGTV